MGLLIHPCAGIGAGALQFPPHPGGGGGTGRFLKFFLLRYRLQQHERIARIKRPPITDASTVTNVRLLSIQLLISFPTLDPLHWPLLHFPPPWHDVPSRKFC